MFGSRGPQLDERHFAWLFENNPCNDTAGGQLWVYADGEEIVGQQAGIPFEFKVNDRFYRASWAIDLMVQPAYRLRGIGPVLSEVYTECNDITIGIGLTELAYKAFSNAGWTDLGSIPLFVRPLDATRMLDSRGDGDGLKRAAAKAAGPGIRLADVAGDVYAWCRSVELERIDRFDDAADGLWTQVSGGYSVIAKRDTRSLSWRFDAMPDADRYQRFYMRRGGAVCGYVVLRLGRRHGAVAGFIVDFLCAPEWMTPLFACCLKHFRRAGAAAVYWTGLHPEAGRRLRPLGFVQRESGVHIMFRSNPVRTTIPDVVGDPRSWFVTSADSDADHPRPDGQGRMQ
jgi:GNAT superfamily N-acetyltransferase